jgi:hypothetical protein
MTAAVAELLDSTVDPLGSFAFRGVAAPVAVFAAPE